MHVNNTTINQSFTVQIISIVIYIQSFNLDSIIDFKITVQNNNTLLVMTLY